MELKPLSSNAHSSSFDHPLKLPPRLLHTPHDFNSFSHRLPATALKAARQISFARRLTWADHYDPFTAAIEKVKGGESGRYQHHPLSYSFSLATGYCTRPAELNDSRDKPGGKCEKLKAFLQWPALFLKKASNDRKLRYFT